MSTRQTQITPRQQQTLETFQRLWQSRGVRPPTGKAIAKASGLKTSTVRMELEALTRLRLLKRVVVGIRHSSYQPIDM